MSTYEQTKAMQASAKAIAADLAAALGPEWHHDPEREWGATIVNDQGAGFHLNSGMNNKYEVSPVWPEREGTRSWDHLRHDENSRDFTIGVGSTKSVEQIARDIQRRFLPEYLPMFATLTERMDKWQRGQEAMAKVAEELATLMGGTFSVPSSRTGRSKFEASPPRSWPGYGSIEVQYDGEKVAIDLHGVPVALARKIAKLIGKESA